MTGLALICPGEAHPGVVTPLTMSIASIFGFLGASWELGGIRPLRDASVAPTRIDPSRTEAASKAGKTLKAWNLERISDTTVQTAFFQGATWKKDARQSLAKKQ